MTYQVRAEDRGRDRAWRASDDAAAAPRPVPGKRTLSEALPPGELGVVQAKAATGAMPASARPALSALFGSPGGGQPLPTEVRTKMERSLGADFADVRVHQGPEAAAIGARAYARGNHLFFAPGQYDPTSEPGQRLLGHELAHVVQQRAGTAKGGQGAGLAVNRDPGLEAEADRAGEQAARGDRAEVAGGTRGATADGDTLQGDFFDDLLLLMAAYYIFRAIAILTDEVLRVRGQLASERALEESERRLAQLRNARAEAKELATAAAHAADIAGRAAAEDHDAREASDAAREAAREARQTEAAAAETMELPTAEAAAARAREQAAAAIAAAVLAVAAVARGHARTAAAAAKAARSEHDGSASAVATAQGFAEASAREATAAEDRAREVATKHDAKDASAALAKAIEHAQSAGKLARSASAEVEQVRAHADAARGHAKDASKAADALGSGSVAALDADEHDLAATAPGPMRDARQAIDDARHDASGARGAARLDAEQTAEDVDTAATHAKVAHGHATRATSAVVKQAHEAISAQRNAALVTQKKLKLLAKRVAEIPELDPLSKRAADSIVTLGALLAQVETAGLDELDPLLQRAFMARGDVEGALSEAQAACIQYDARAMVSAAMKLDHQLVQQVEAVGAVVGSGEEALREARATTKLATQALDRAAQLQHKAREMMRQISLDDREAVGLAKSADQLFQQAEDEIAQAREHLRAAQAKANQAEQLASSVPDKAALHGERAAIEKSQSELRKTPARIDVSAERKQLEGHDASAARSMDALAKQRGAANALGRDARSEQGEITKADKAATALGREGQDAALAQGLALVDQARERAAEEARRVKELARAASDIELSVKEFAPKQLASVASNANEPGEREGRTGEQALEAATLALAALRKQVDVAAAGARELNERLAALKVDGSLTTTTAALGRATEQARELGQVTELASRTAAEARAALREIDDYVRSRQPDRREAPKERDVRAFQAEEAEEPIGDQQLGWYADAYRRISPDRVLDPENLTARGVPTADRSRFFSDLMELTYLGRGVRDGAYVQVGRMTATALRAALRAHPELRTHLDAFDAGAKDDAVRFDRYELCYQADGVLWFRDRVEVVQHKRSVEAKPLEDTMKHGRKYVALDEALRGAANQLSGYTNEGGTDAMKQQPETPPPGLARTLQINIQLPNAAPPEPDDDAYSARINEIMAERAGNGQGPAFHATVQRIEITWGTGKAKVVGRFVRGSGGTTYNRQ